MNNKLWALGLAGLLSLSSCSGDRVFEEFYAFDRETWAISDTATFDLDLPEDPMLPLIAVRYNESYPFSNLYLRIESRDSSGVVLDNKLLNVPIFDSKSGQPLGKGFGNTYTKYDTLPLPMDAKISSIALIQYMRQESIDGLEAVGLKILKK